jgi:hypothetical protein
MKLDVFERMQVCFIWNADQTYDGYPVSLPFRGVADTALIYTHQPNSITGASDGGLIELEQTWNTTGAPTALWINITDTASAVDSKLFDFLVNGISMASLTKGGVFTASGVVFDNVITGHIRPKATDTYDLGLPADIWKNIYVRSITATDAAFSGTVTFNGPVVFNSTVAGGIVTSDMTLTGNLTVGGFVDFAHGLQAGSTNNQIIDDFGRIPEISALFFSSLSGVNLTGVGLLASNNAWAGRQDFSAYSEEHTSIAIAGAELTIDMALGSVFEFTYNASIGTTTVTNAPVSGKYGSFVLLVNTVGAALTWAWFTSLVHWPDGTPPTITATAGRIDKYFFWTRNGGATWHGAVVAQNYAP